MNEREQNTRLLKAEDIAVMLSLKVQLFTQWGSGVIDVARTFPWAGTLLIRALRTLRRTVHLPLVARTGFERN
jgi:hypothetical protein